MLEILHPLVARRSCDDCRRWIYNDGPDGDRGLCRREPGGPPEPRGPAIPVPCETSETACPKGHWRKPRSLTAANLEAYRYHESMRAAGRPLPADPIVLRNAGLIEAAKARIAEVRRMELMTTIRATALHRRMS